MKTKTRQNAKIVQMNFKLSKTKPNAGTREASKHVLCWCAAQRPLAELQTIDPKTKTFHVSLHRSQCHKNTCISLRDTALAGINYRQSGGGTRTWRAAGGYVRHIADNLSCIVRNLYNTTYTSPPQDTGGQVSFVCLSPHARQQHLHAVGRTAPARGPEAGPRAARRCTGWEALHRSTPDVRGLARRFV